ncbi:MAG: type II toxin-antitoxin system VapC family toxin [Candidatus Competibacteraceae bacterium]
MSYLIDTNVISELRKGQRCDPNVAQWFASVADVEIYLSVLVIGELRRGIEFIRRRDPIAATALETWLKQVMKNFDNRILVVNQEIAEELGRMNALTPLSTIDSLLAATAKVNGLTLVTRNVKDIVNAGVCYLNPFESRST